MRSERWSYPSWPVPASGSRVVSGMHTTHLDCSKHAGEISYLSRVSVWRAASALSLQRFPMIQRGSLCRMSRTEKA